MTQNDKIAEIMGWEKYYGQGYWCWRDNEGNTIYGESELDFDDMNLVKRLQARMVADGWLLSIKNNRDGEYIVEAYLNPCDPDDISTNWCKTEPAALVSLFAKVYNIEGEG